MHILDSVYYHKRNNEGALMLPFDFVGQARCKPCGAIRQHSFLIDRLSYLKLCLNCSCVFVKPTALGHAYLLHYYHKRITQ